MKDENVDNSSQKKLKKTLLFYTMNEIEGVKNIFDKIPINLFDEFFTIDNNSTDGTVEFLEKRGVKIIQQKKTWKNKCSHRRN